MKPWSNALQEAIDPAKPLFELARTILTYYALIALDVVLFLQMRAGSIEISIFLGVSLAAMLILSLFCCFSLQRVGERFVDGLLAPPVTGWSQRIARLAFSLFMLSFSMFVPITVATIAVKVTTAGH